MKTTFQISVEINKKPQAVFNCLAELSCHYKWNPHLVSVFPETRLHEGMTYQTVSRLLGEETTGLNTVTSMEPPHRLVIDNQAGFLKYHVEYRLTDLRPGTRLTCRCVIEADSQVFHLAHTLVEMIAKDELYSDLRALKLVVEEAQ